MPAATPSPAPGLDSAAGVAATIEAAFGDLHAAGTAGDADAAVRLERAYLTLIDHPTWVGIAKADLSAADAQSATSNLAALEDLHTLNPPYPQLPPWLVVQPVALTQLIAWYQEAQAASGVPWRYLAAINFVETQFGRINADSRTGAQGPMQFEPATWASYGRGDVHDPHQAILAAARYLRAGGAPGDMAGALFSYNPTRLYVDCVTRYANLMADPATLQFFYDWDVYTWTAAGVVVISR